MSLHASAQDGLEQEANERTGLLLSSRVKSNTSSCEDTPIIIEEGIGNSNLDPYLRWFENEILNPSNASLTQKLAMVVGGGMGLTSSIIAYNLSYDFGEGTTDNKGFSIYLGSTAVVPLAILGAQFSILTFRSLVTRTSKEEKALHPKECDKTLIIRVPAKALSYVIGAISSSPFVYIVNQYYQPLMGTWALSLEIPTFISRSLIDQWAVVTLVKESAGFLEDKVIKSKMRSRFDEDKLKRWQLKEKLEDSKSLIDGMTENQINQLIEEIWKSQQDNEESLVGSLKHFFNLKNYIDEVIPKKRSIGRKVARYVGDVVGAISAWAIEPLTEISVKTFLSSQGIEDPDDTIAQISGWTSWFAGACLLTYTTGDTFEKIYGWIEDAPQNISALRASRESRTKSAVKIGSVVLSAVLSASSAAPRVELTLEYVHTVLKPLVIACSALGPFALDFWAIDGFFEGLLKKGNKRQLLNLSIDKMIGIIPDMDKKYVSALHETVFQDVGQVYN